MNELGFAGFALLVLAARVAVALAGFAPGCAARDARRRLAVKPGAPQR